MKKNLFIYWTLFLTILFVSCSDSNDPIPPDPDPIPTEDIKEGINQFPETFSADKEAKVVFKAASNSALYGYAGDVYVHIGIVEGETWIVVPTEWGKNEERYKMKKVEGEEYTWSFSLSPNIRSWFGVSEDIVITKIGILFRSADGTKKGIEDDSFLWVEDANTFIPGEVVMEAMPANTVEGINIMKDENTVTFVLYDRDINGKRKDYVHLIGDFNDWKLNNDYQMKRDETSGCWWYTLGGLDPQVEYAFQYYVSGKDGEIIRLADAYTEKVLDPQDKDITAYPNLRPYPSDKTAGVISTFQIEQEVYTWKNPSPVVSNKHNLVVYEMLFRDFTESGDIKGAKAKLGYLKELGVNAIELMPIQEFDGNISWGYDPCYFFALDKAYGTKEDYKDFIDECHRLGMAVILDVVYNHATGAHPFARLYWDSKANKTAANNPWFNVDAPHPYSVFHDFNHESPLVRAFVKRNLAFLLNEYKVDGFRFDLTKGFTQNASTEANASNYDASRINILKDYNNTVKEVNPDAVVILEHFAVDKEELELAKEGMLLWRNLNYAYSQTAMGWSDDSSFASLYTTTSFSGGWIGYMESHDEERMAYTQLTNGNYNLKTDLATRMKQLEVNAALFFTVPGSKMLWQFGELGYDVSINENGRTGKKPVKWDYYENMYRRNLYDTYSKLISLRTQTNQDLFVPSTDIVKDATNWGTGRYVSLKSITGKGLVAVGNFTNAEVTCNVNFQSTGTWYDYMGDGQTLNVTSSTQAVKVPAHSFKVYTTFQQ